MIRRFALALLCLSTVLHAQAPVTVYVFTKSDPSGLVDRDAQTRATAVEALSKTLGKSKVVQVVTTPAEATVQVEITKTDIVEEADHLSALNNALNGAHNSDVKKVTYRVATLRVGDYTTEIRGRANAKNETGLSREVENWVKANAGRLTK